MAEKGVLMETRERFRYWKKELLALNPTINFKEDMNHPGFSGDTIM